MPAEKQLSRYSLTEYNRSQRLLSRLRDIYGRARSFHLSHAQILETLSREIYHTADYKKLTAYYQGFFQATREALSGELYHYHLEWRVYLDGRLVPSRDVPAGAWARVRGGEHVWSTAPDRLFSTPDLTEKAGGDKVQSS